MTIPADRLSSLSDPALGRLLSRARSSLERTGADLHANIGVTDPSEDERRAISGLLGRHIKTGTKRVEVNLAQLDERIRARTGAPLIEVLPALTGQPLRNLPDTTAKDTAARGDLLALAHASPLNQTSWFSAWIDTIQTDGTFTRLLNSPGRFERAIRVLELIDGSQILLPTLATRATGHSHALDARTPLSGLVLTALAARAGIPAPKRAEERRDLWDRFNVIVDDLASRVLVLNLPADGQGLGEWLTDAGRYATPFQITLHQLLNHPIRFTHQRIYVCENPAVLREAAEVLGPSSPPLICTEGQPSVAFHRLAAQVTRNGGQLHYHGDFDWPGIRIVNMMVSRHGASPWRMSSADYLAGLSLIPDAEESGAPTVLSGDSQMTPWDLELSHAMTARNLPLFEEAVVDRLICDLASGEPR